MDILVIGSGGREHALCSAFRKSPKTGQLFCANGNAGIAGVATCVQVLPEDVDGLASFAASNGIGLTFVGGETTLAAGIVDLFESRGLPIIGPTREAAQLESSKSFAKDFMARHGIPTARYLTAHTPGFAIDELESGDFGDASTPVVVKADGLAAGKGVIVARNRAEAVAAIEGLEGLVGSDATRKIVIEECLVGTEVSLLMFVDGEDFLLMPAVRDHKRIGEGDTGPNTGGMGTFTTTGLLSDSDLQNITDAIVRPTLRGCVREGWRFRGVLFLGLMMTSEGPKVLEYNVRFGDPEAQAILVRLETDLVDICEALLRGTVAQTSIAWRPGASACIVLASNGYPGKPTVGDKIVGLEDAAAIPGVEIFHAGTVIAGDGSTVTAGGRVVGVTAVGSELESALSQAYSAVGKISWPGMQYRRDIGKPQ